MPIAIPLDTVKVVGFPPETTEDQLAIYFGQIGTIKKGKDKAAVFINREKNLSYIHYEDIATAASAPKWFNKREFPDTGSGYTITVTVVSQCDRNQGCGLGGPSGDCGRDGGRGGVAIEEAEADKVADKEANHMRVMGPAPGKLLL